MLSVLYASLGACSDLTFTLLGDDQTCTRFDLSKLPTGSFSRNDSYPEPYILTRPCGTADVSKCKSCTGAAASSMVQLAPKLGCAGTRCIACEKEGSEPTSVTMSAQNTLSLTFGGGLEGRKTSYDMVCDTSVPATNEPNATIGTGTSAGYVVTWHTPLACGVRVPSGSAGCVAPPLAQPTKSLLAWQAGEIGALVHFNMQTYGSCSHDVATFNPTHLNTKQWVESFQALGVKQAVLVAKHGCGFVLWPTKASVPGGARYNYSVAYTDAKRDVAREFLDACNNATPPIRTGFYYSLNSKDDFAKRNGWSADEIVAIQKEQLAELWGHGADEYGNANGPDGGHAELWFDGGFEGAIEPWVKTNLRTLQPNAVAFNGCVQQGAGNNASLCVTPNSVRWIGTEAGVAPTADWSTGFRNGGDPDSDLFQPAESDTTLQNGDQWFYNDNVGIRSLATLITVYHGTVGRNALLMLDFAPDPLGLIADDQVARYAEFGAWIKQCYGPGRAVGEVKEVKGPNATISFANANENKNGALVDRIWVREDQSTGQRIRKWAVEAQLASSPESPANGVSAAAAAWQIVASGTSVGNKAIRLFTNGTLRVAALRLRVAAAYGGKLEAVGIVSFAAFKCNRPSDTGCSITKDEKVSFSSTETLKQIKGATSSTCCALCSAIPQCAAFVLDPSKLCSAISAEGVSSPAPGWITGSPN